MNLDRWEAAWPFLRDVVIVFAALGMMAFEVLNGGEVRQEVMLACTGLVLSPVFIRRDAKDHKATPDDPAPTPREADR